jgi:GNAT superfamily N-acetyltransferase
MIRFKQIKTADAEQFNFMEQLMETSFPPEERRLSADLRRYTDEKESMHISIIEDNDVAVGLFNYWTFPEFYYVEHFAVLPELRNKGYGSRTLQYAIDAFDKAIVLEVEPPSTDTARRRIGFYQRNGFRLWSANYQHPPYHGNDFLPMRLIVYGNMDCEKDFEAVKHILHSEVYGR